MRKKTLLIYVVIFLISFSIHLFGLNQIGRTWDEQFKIDFGYVGVENLLKGNFSEDIWKHESEHPMVAKYIYGLSMRPEMIPIDIGEDGSVKVPIYEVARLKSGSYNLVRLNQTVYAIPYNFTLPRIISALAASLSVVATAMIAGFLLENSLWVVLVGAFLVFNPRFVFLGQLVTFESLTALFFSLTVLAFFRLLGNPKKVNLHVVTGLLCGLLFWTRYNNVIIFPFLAGWLGIHYWYTKEKGVFNWRLALIPIIALIFGIATWPLLWHHFPKHLLESFQFHQIRTEVSAYYWHYFLVTTPIPIIFGFVIGSVACFFKRSYAKTFLLWWIICIVVVYTLLTIPLSGTRYASVLYLPICILAAYGYVIILRGRSKLLLVPIILFLIYEQLNVFPYYLDYYNQLVGGVNGAIKRGYDFSWWGEGQAEVGRWLNDNGSKGSTVGLIVTPKYVFPETLENIESEGYVDEKSNADYIVVSHGNLVKLSKDFFMNHQLIYSAQVSSQPLVSLYRKTR